MHESCGNLLIQNSLLSFFILKLARLRSKHEKEVGELNANLEEAYGSSNRPGNATKINELRAEVINISCYFCEKELFFLLP